jgi:circadian clock protein KaiB
MSKTEFKEMSKKDDGDVTDEFEKALKEESQRTYILRLFVTGMTPKSQKAIENVRKMCDEHLKGRCELEIIDIYQQPDYARTEQLIAAPTLIKKLPLPLRKFIGDMSDKEKILVGLDIIPKKKQ